MPQSKKWFKEFLESAPDAIVIVDKKGLIVFSNRQTERLFGYERTELEGISVEQLMPGKFRKNHVGHVNTFMDNPKVRMMGTGMELIGLKKDGSEFPVEISLSPLEAEGDMLVSAAIRDITDRKKAEMKFRGLLESAPDAMVIVDRQGRVVLSNIQTEKLFGYSKKELGGMRVEQLMPSKFRERHLTHRKDYSNTPNVRMMGTGRELSGLKKDGMEFPVEISLSPIETEEGLLFCAAIRDITKQKEAENTIIKLNQSLEQKVLERTRMLTSKTLELERSNADLEQFAFLAAHDIKAPITNVQALVDLLDSTEAVKEGGLKIFEKLRFSISQMKRTIDVLNEVISIKKSMELDSETIRFADVLEGVKSKIEEQIVSSGTRIESDFQVPTVFFPPVHLENIFQNLITNSIKYHHPERAPHIRVSTSVSDNDRVILTFADNGRGMDVKLYKKKLFGLFQRFHLDVEGRGIGLHIIKTIIENYNGMIEVDSELDRGTTFTITFSNRSFNMVTGHL